MENINNLELIKDKYKNCNLLLPTSTEVRINPFYQYTVMEVTVDTSEHSGDIFKVGSIKSGRKSNEGKDIYVDTFSPAKPLLMKLSTAAGIQFDPSNTHGSKLDKNTYKAKAFGAIRLSDGSGKTHADEKVICLDDEEANYVMEFMDKSIKGIVDDKQAKAAAELFKGEWIDSVSKWNKKCKAYVIRDIDRQKYIDRAVMVNMVLLRKTVAEKAMTGAINRVVRALVGLKGSYTKEELDKGFAIPKVTFSPDYNDPMVRRAMIEQGMNSMSNMFGTVPLSASAQIPCDSSDSMFDMGFIPEENTDNLAYESDSNAIDVKEDVSVKQLEVAKESTGYYCEDCNAEVGDKVYGYSLQKFGRPLCMKCQKGGK